MTSPLLTEIDEIEKRCGSLPQHVHRLLQIARSAVEQAVPDEWFIWSNEHRAYWRPNSSGYVIDARGAGSYSLKEALEICRSANIGIAEGQNPNEIVTSSAALASQWLAQQAEQLSTDSK